MDSQPLDVGNCSSNNCNKKVRKDHQKNGLSITTTATYFITRPSHFQAAACKDRPVVKPFGPQGNQCILVLPRDVQQVMISEYKRTSIRSA